MTAGFGKRTMRRHARMIFWLLLLLVGLQWVGDPVDVRLTGSQNPAAGWHHLDDNGPDNSHHFGVALLDENLFSLDHVAILPPVIKMAGPALLGWLLPASDSSSPPPITISHQTPRAPPAA
jgi:hypothetical protein